MLTSSCRQHHLRASSLWHRVSCLGGEKYGEIRPRSIHPPAGTKTEWEILLELAERLYAQRRGLKFKGQALAMRVMRLAGVERILDLGLRTGPYGFGKGHPSGGLSIKKLKENPDGFDLGHLTSQLPNACTRRISM